MIKPQKIPSQNTNAPFEALPRCSDWVLPHIPASTCHLEINITIHEHLSLSKSQNMIQTGLHWYSTSTKAFNTASHKHLAPPIWSPGIPGQSHTCIVGPALQLIFPALDASSTYLWQGRGLANRLPRQWKATPWWSVSKLVSTMDVRAERTGPLYQCPFISPTQNSWVTKFRPTNIKHDPDAHATARGLVTIHNFRELYWKPCSTGAWEKRIRNADQDQESFQREINKVAVDDVRTGCLFGLNSVCWSNYFKKGNDIRCEPIDFY